MSWRRTFSECVIAIGGIYSCFVVIIRGLRGPGGTVTQNFVNQWNGEVARSICVCLA